MLECEECGFESNSLDDICYYSINGIAHNDEHDIDDNLDNKDALAHVLCRKCIKIFRFKQS